MSILIAYKRGDTVYMGTDTRVIIADHKKNEVCESNFKIRKMENGMLVGIMAPKLIRQTIFAYSEIFTLDKKGELTRKHIVKHIIPKLMDILDDEGILIKKEDELPVFTGEILLAYGGELFEICREFTVYKYESYQAIGPVASFGQFILANAKQPDDVNQTILKALDMVAKHSQFVGEPYLLIDTKHLEYKLIRGEN